jgi:hypothetical protein
MSDRTDEELALICPEVDGRCVYVRCSALSVALFWSYRLMKN